MWIVTSLLWLLAFAQASNEAQAIEQARASLAAELGMEEPELTLVRAQPVEWPSASLGCERPGDIPAEAEPVSGHRVLFSAPDGVYTVHVGAGRAVVCAGPLRRGQAPVVERHEASGQDKGGQDMGTVDLPDHPEHRELVEQAISELATRLDVNESVVELVGFQKVMWSDRSLGCPRPGMFYAQVLTEGYRAQLRVNGKVYSYHGGLRGELTYCEQPRKPQSMQ